jgi:cyclophilin family peptidyl-prolyl cis-trans isomerase
LDPYSYTQSGPQGWRAWFDLTNPTAVLDTSMGVIKLELFAKEAPITVQNFMKLCRDGFYDGLVFHRVIPGFMIQGGCPIGDGTGGPGYVIKDEFVASLKHTSPGVLSMANAGPNTGGSQFFITLAPTPWLDGKHTIFGKVTEGMDVLQSIGKVRTDSRDRPLESVKIRSAKITDK